MPVISVQGPFLLSLWFLVMLWVHQAAVLVTSPLPDTRGKSMYAHTCNVVTEL